MFGTAPGDIYSGEKNMHPECKIKHILIKGKGREEGKKKSEKQTCPL